MEKTDKELLKLAGLEHKEAKPNYKYYKGRLVENIYYTQEHILTFLRRNEEEHKKEIDKLKKKISQISRGELRNCNECGKLCYAKLCNDCRFEKASVNQRSQFKKRWEDKVEKLEQQLTKLKKENRK